MTTKRLSAAVLLACGLGSMAPMRAVGTTNSGSVATVVTPAAGATKAPDLDEKGYLKLGFDQLASYTFNPPAFDPAASPDAKPPTGEEQIPATVKSWNGKKAVITGYMVPV